MLQVGIFNGYFPYALEEQAKKIKSIGFNTVQLDLAFKDVDFSTPDSINLEKAKRIRETFRDYNLPISCISGYTNIVHPDSAKRKEKLDYLKALIKSARHFGTPYVISETGTLNPKSDWVSDPKNKTEEGFQDCKKVIKELAQVAFDYGAVFLLETYVNNVIGSIEETVRIFAEVDHPGLADIALFLSGIFPEHAALFAAPRRTMYSARRTLKDFEHTGRRFYRVAALETDQAKWKPVLGTLAEKFTLARLALTSLSERYVKTRLVRFFRFPPES